MSVIGIIGAGPAGMMAAITAAKSKQHTVYLFEGNDRVGKKILSTGNGKCNLTNKDMKAEYFYSSSPNCISGFLTQFSENDTISFFDSLGILLKDKNGYIYPNSEQASTILDALRFELEHNNIILVSDFKVTTVTKNKNSDRFVICSGKKQYEADKVVLATGGKAAPKTGSDGSGYIIAKSFGHKLISTVPALVQLICKENFMKSISGVRCQATVSVYEDFEYNKLLQKETGELQLTDYGISGIPVFQLSRKVNYQINKQKELYCLIDFLPEYTEEKWQEVINKREKEFLSRTAEEYYFGILNKKITALFLKLADIKPTDLAENVSKKKRIKVYEMMRQFSVTITGNKGFDNAQVTAGGVDLKEVSDTLESAFCPGLYFAGELLDVDGRCGGYNLQWAFTSGYIAGKSASGNGAKL